MHIHEGTSCDTDGDVGGHYWDASLADPWTEDATKYETNAGKAQGSFQLNSGYTFDGNVGHVVVVHNAGGNRVACGVLRVERVCEPVVRTLRCGLEGGEPFMDEDDMGMTELICVKDGTTKHNSHDHGKKDHGKKAEPDTSAASATSHDHGKKESKGKGNPKGGESSNMYRTTMRSAQDGPSIMITGAVGVVAGLIGAMFAMAVQTRMKRTFSPEPAPLNVGELTHLLNERVAAETI